MTATDAKATAPKRLESLKSFIRCIMMLVLANTEDCFRARHSRVAADAPLRGRKREGVLNFRRGRNPPPVKRFARCIMPVTNTAECLNAGNSRTSVREVWQRSKKEGTLDSPIQNRGAYKSSSASTGSVNS